MSCEAKETEPGYVNGLKALPEVHRHAAIRIEIDPGDGKPLPLVRRAVDRVGDDEIDEIWCLFDVESPQPHPNLEQAVRLARRHGIRLAISNPCFELWLILHQEECTAYRTTAAAERRSRRLDGRTGKRIDAAIYLPHRHRAAARARTLTARHLGDGTAFPDDNRSSGMPDFLDAVEGAR
ncbi:MAG: RloB family protein [Pseudonocardia sp.]